MKNFLPTLLAVVALLSVGASSVSASSPRRFYDWSTTLETADKGKVLGWQVSAQEGTTGAQFAPKGLPATSFLQFNTYIIGGNLTPDSPFHFLKRLQENMVLTFTLDAKKKEETRLAIAGERLEEAKKLAEQGKIAGINTASNAYSQNMLVVAKDLENLKNKNADIDDLLKTIETETAKHNVVLEKVEASVPDTAKKAIARAIEASEANIDKIADLTNRPAVPKDVVDRITALKAQGLLTEEEAVKLISLKTRTEARSELRKYVNEGVIPASDFIRMNENVKTYFPQDFYQIHEVKRFYILKKLEEQKPDEMTLARIQEFAKTYKPGEIVPSDLRKYWSPVLQLDEIQTTFRPDLVDPNLFKNNPEDQNKFQEIVERYKPRPEDVAFIQSYMGKSNTSVSSLPPEYQRMYNMSQTYGAQCGAGQKWIKQDFGSGGYCAPQDFNQNLPPPINLISQPTSCRGNIVSAKSQAGICSAYPSDCVPSGWTVVDSCVVTAGEEIGIKNTERPRPRISCPSNAHFVPVAYDPNGGYCVSNYTPTGEEIGKTTTSGIPETPCSQGYHRNYSGGPCLQDMVYNRDVGTGQTYSLPPLTVNPGNYPNPFFGSPTSNPVPSAVEGFPLPSPGSVSGCKPPDRGCEQGKGWDQGACACRDNNSYPSACAQPSGGCGSGKYWDKGTCTCATSCPSDSAWNGRECMKNSSPPSPGGGASSGGSYSPPPSGYGTCGSGQYWNGSSCVSSQPPPASNPPPAEHPPPPAENPPPPSQ